MTTFFASHKNEIIVWSIVGVFLFIFLLCCFLPHPSVSHAVVTPTVHRPMRPVGVSIELVPRPRAFIPAPLYQEHHHDLALPDDVVLEKHSDGYLYLKHWNSIGG